MPGIISRVRARVRSALLSRATSGGGLDLSKIDKVPESLSWPLSRDDFGPVTKLGEIRRDEPVHKLTSFFGIRVWMVTGDAEAREVMSNTTSFSNDIRPFVGEKSGSTTDGDIGGLGFTDPPEHTRLRKLLTPEFTMRRLERLKPRIAEIIEAALDEVEAAGPEVDLVSTFAFPVPFQVICELLGLPAEQRERFSELATARFDVTYGGTGVLGAISGSREFLLDFAAQQRRDPGDGLVGQIIREHGDEINDHDLGGLADGAFTGGLETSASMLALGTAVLLNHPDEYAALAEGTADVDAVVEELLRYLGVVQIAFPRFAKHDIEIAGRKISEGDVVVCHLAGINRDERMSADGESMETFNPRRAVAGSHMAFGYGFHRCVGAELAKMELRMAYPMLAKRFPDLRLADTDLTFRQKSIVYGVDSLPVVTGLRVPA
ncbi:MAG: cytochrome P450 [Nocardioidaceae bacterium]